MPEEQSINEHQRVPGGSNWHALRLEAMLAGEEPPVPPFESLHNASEGWTVYDTAVDASFYLEDKNDVRSSPKIGIDYRDRVRDLYDQKREDFQSFQPTQQLLKEVMRFRAVSPQAMKIVDKWRVPMQEDMLVGAVTSPEGFMAAYEHVKYHHPENLLYGIDELSLSVTKEELKDVAKKVLSIKDWSCIKSTFDNLADLNELFEDEPEIIRTYVREMMPVADASLVLTRITHKSVQQHFTFSEAKELVDKAILKATELYNRFPSYHTISCLQNADLIEPSRVEEALLKAMTNPDVLSRETMAELPEMVSPEKIASVKAQLLTKLKNQSNPRDFDQLANHTITCGLFSADELFDVYKICSETGNMETVVSRFELLAGVFTDEQLEVLLMDIATNKPDAHPYFTKQLINQSILDRVQLNDQTMYDLLFYSYEHSTASPQSIMGYINALPKPMRKQLVTDICETSALHRLLQDPFTDQDFTWQECLGDPLEQRQYLRQLFTEKCDFGALRLLANLEDGYSRLPFALFSREELREMCQVLIKNMESTEILAFASTIAQINPVEAEAIIRRTGLDNPFDLVTFWKPDYSAYFSPDELMGIIEEAYATQPTKFDRYSSHLDDYLPRDRFLEILSTSAALFDDPDEMMFDIDGFLSGIPAEDADHFVKLLVTKNPDCIFTSPLAIEKLGFKGYEDYESWRRENTTKFAPRSLSKIVRRLEKADTHQVRVLEKDESDLYNQFAWVLHAGQGETYKRLAGLDDNYDPISGKNRTEKQERELLHLLSAVARQNQWYEQEALDQVTSIAELRVLVEDATLKNLGISELTEQQRDSFRKMITDIAPFATYTASYYNSTEHQVVLRDMLTAVTEGNYQSWRYSADEPLEGLKELGWIPQNLSEVQYEAWQTGTNQTVSIGEVDGGEKIGENIASLIRQNTQHLGGVDFSNPDAETIAANQIRELGQKLKAAHILRKTTDQVDEKRIKDLEAQLKAAKYTRAAFTLHSADKHDDDKIKKVLSDFRNGLPADGQFLADRVEEIIALSGAVIDDAVVTDIDDPQTTIEIGAKPVPSCQHYAGGSVNECLLGYFDANVKPVVIKNKSGNIIARAIMRLLEREDTGEAVLFMEPAYTSYDDKQVTAAFQSFVATKAAQLGVSYVSELENDLSMIKQAQLLTSRASRAPQRYSDGLSHVASIGHPHAIGSYFNPSAIKGYTA